MTKKELEAYKSIKKRLEEETLELFRYIKEKHLDVLAFGRYSSYHHYGLNDKIIWIEYYDHGYDCYDSSDIDIPIDDFLNRPKEWVDEWANKIREERKKQKQKQLENEEKREREELQRLKEKYEKGE
jgi:hypothetical protein